ncbi:GNAT family N-acetyltransferase [Weissella minor]|uniref:GNAT family N-acetyltransferase n=1 Tax=Weissella minor TaxID=1620 RepID=UPI001BAF638A|nr:GNAT family N-acetyltransferase [Weissella minor]MBS0949093.1 GNAT family N-acetyltransferase [Weissella minor]
MWQIKAFDELTTNELFEIMRLRIAVFVVEQKRIYQEADDVDQQAIHIFKTENGRVVAYARVFKEAEQVVFGRVAVAQGSRGNGLANELMHQISETLTARFKGQSVHIIAQTDVQGFYEKWGYIAVGEPYIHNQTPHIDMILDNK